MNNIYGDEGGATIKELMSAIAVAILLVIMACLLALMGMVQ